MIPACPLKIAIEHRRAADFIRESGDGSDRVMEVVGDNLRQFGACSAKAEMDNKEKA